MEISWRTFSKQTFNVSGQVKINCKISGGLKKNKIQNWAG